MWLYLVESAACPSSAESGGSTSPCLTGSVQSLTAKSTPTLRELFCLKWLGEISRGLQYGTTSQLLDDSNFASFKEARPQLGLSTSFMEAFLARTSALRALEKGWQESEAVWFSRSFGCVGSWDRTSSSWKTSQQSLPEVASKSLERLPNWGICVDGALLALGRPVPHLRKVSGGFYWPRPTARDGKGSDLPKRRGTASLPQLVKNLGYPGKLNPDLIARLLGYPQGWGISIDFTGIPSARNKHGWRSRSSCSGGAKDG